MTTKLVPILLIASAGISGCPDVPLIRGMPAYEEQVTGLASDCGKGATASLVTDCHPLAGANRHWVEQTEGEGETVEELYHGDIGERFLKVGPWKCFFRKPPRVGTPSSMVVETECWAFDKPDCRARMNMQNRRPSSLNKVPWDSHWKPLDEPVVPTSELMSGSLEEAQVREFEVRGLED